MKYLIVALLLPTCWLFSQSIVGKWISIDADTKQEKSIVEIYQKDGKYVGKIVEFLEEGVPPDAVCSHCEGSMKNKKLMGFHVLRDFKKEGTTYVDGTIIDPEKDKTYDAKIWVDEEDSNVLNLRGYVAMFYKTIQWKRWQE